MSDHRAKRRTPDQCRDILRTIKRGEDGKPLPGETKRVAKNAGVSPATVRGWVARLGWPEDSAVEEAERRAERRQAKSVATHPPRALQRIDTSGAGRAPKSPQAAAQGGSEVRCNAPAQSVATHRLSPREEMVARLAARDTPYSRIATAVGVHRSTVRRWVTEPGPIVDLIGELRTISRPQIRSTAAHIALQSMDATAAGYDVAQDIQRERVEAEEALQVFDSENPMVDEDGNAIPLDGDGRMTRLALVERVDALRGQYLMAVKALEPSRKTTLQSMGILDGGVGDGLEKGRELTPREKRIEALEAELAAMESEE